MRKRILSLALAVVVAVSLIPISSSAASRLAVTNTKNVSGQDIVNEARNWTGKTYVYKSPSMGDIGSYAIALRTGYTDPVSFDCSGFVSRVLNDAGFRSNGYPGYDCILKTKYGSNYIGTEIVDELVRYGTDVTSALQKAKNGDFSELKPGDLLAWSSHIVIYGGRDSAYGNSPMIVEVYGDGNDGAVCTYRKWSYDYAGKYTYAARLTEKDTHTIHDKGEYVFQEDAHPHCNCYRCSVCGEIWKDTSSKNYWSTCETCRNHTHDKGEYVFQEDAHPHCSCYKCSFCGEIWKDTLSKNYWSSCEICRNHTHDKGEYVFQEDAHPHCNCYKCSLCGEIWRDTSSSNYWATCSICTGPYTIGPLTVRNTSGDPLTAIPSGSFLVTVPITKQTAGGDAMVLLASYTESGRYRGLMYVSIKNATEGATVEVTLSVDNAAGDVAVLKAFAIPSFGDPTPLGPDSVFPAGE